MATSFIIALFLPMFSLFTTVITTESNKARADINITENSRDVASGKGIPVFNVVTFPNRFCIFHLSNVSVGINIFEVSTILLLQRFLRERFLDNKHNVYHQ